MSAQQTHRSLVSDDLESQRRLGREVSDLSQAQDHAAERARETRVMRLAGLLRGSDDSMRTGPRTNMILRRSSGATLLLATHPGSVSACAWT